MRIGAKVARAAALGGVLAALLCAVLAPAAGAAAGDPLFVYVPGGGASPPPTGSLRAPCGIAVDSAARFYVSDYYHHKVDVFEAPTPITNPPSYKAQLEVDPLDGPCGLALSATDRLYVNDYHRAAIRYGPFGAFGAGSVFAGAGVDEAHPTGIAADPAGGRIYVNERTQIAAYDANGAPIEEAGQPLAIGVGNLSDGYGLAIDAAGRLYVADASTNAVKVYDPSALDKEHPIAEIHGPGKGFTSLTDAALAVDRSGGATHGNLYVTDNLQPTYTERPAAQVDVFNSSGAYLGVLRYKIIDALPAGLAVDNSAQASRGRVYVTSGNTDQAGVYAYAPGSQVASAQPPTAGLNAVLSGTGEGRVSASLGGLECASVCSAQIRSGATITLTAVPEPGSEFSGFSGACEGMGSCEVQMGQPLTVSAEFTKTETGEGQGAAAPSAFAMGAPSARSATAKPKRHQTRHHRHKRHHRKLRRR
jgi:DNA-binding beta-propeller fold protein YncE